MMVLFLGLHLIQDLKFLKRSIIWVMQVLVLRHIVLLHIVESDITFVNGVKGMSGIKTIFEVCCMKLIIIVLKMQKNFSIYVTLLYGMQLKGFLEF